MEALDSKSLTEEDVKRTFEEAGVEWPDGLTVRIYDVGAYGVYFDLDGYQIFRLNKKGDKFELSIDGAQVAANILPAFSGVEGWPVTEAVAGVGRGILVEKLKNIGAITKSPKQIEREKKQTKKREKMDAEIKKHPVLKFLGISPEGYHKIHAIQFLNEGDFPKGIFDNLEELPEGSFVEMNDGALCVHQQDYSSEIRAWKVVGPSQDGRYTDKGVLSFLSSRAGNYGPRKIFLHETVANEEIKSMGIQGGLASTWMGMKVGSTEIQSKRVPNSIVFPIKIGRYQKLLVVKRKQSPSWEGGLILR